jgi:superfamily II DNA or RNA helicase
MAVRVTVDSRVRIALADLPDGVADQIRARFDHENPAAGKLGEPERYRTWRDVPAPGPEQTPELSVPRGGMSRVRAVLRENGLCWAVADRRTWLYPADGFPDHLRTERPYQARLRAAAEAKENCLLHGATGSGKTCVLYSLLARLKRRALVMVWMKSLLEQWLDRAEQELGMAREDVGIIQGSTERLEPLTLCMQQTIASRFSKGDVSLADQFDILACDEVQRMAADTCYAAVDPFTARYRIGVSADSSRRDLKEFLTHDLFGDVAEEITEEETIEAGATVDVEVCCVPTNFKAPWYRFRQDFNRLLAQMTADEERNALILRIAAKVVSEGEQVLLFTHRVEHARVLDSRLVGLGIRSGCLLGGVDNEVAFARAAEGFRSGDHRAGVGTFGAIGQGIDLPSVSRGIVTTPISNNKQSMNQVRGRICRSSDGKEFGRLYVLVDEHIYGRKPVRNFVQWFRSVKVLKGSVWVDGAVYLRSRRDGT